MYHKRFLWYMAFNITFHALQQKSNRKIDRDHQAVSIRTFRPDLSLMCQHHTPRDGQSKSLAAGLAVSGLIRTVEPVKQMGQLIPVQQLRSRIGYGQGDTSPLLFQLYRQPSPGRRVF